MPRGFESLEDADVGAGRIGRIHAPHAPQGHPIDTPAFFPVLNLMGGPTPVSGGIWSRLRNRLFGDPAFQGAMFQAMSFLDFNLTPEQVETWRHDADGLHDWFTGHESPKDNAAPAPFTQPLFVDSGGFKLMNSRTFGDAPEAGGNENEWGIYTNPESILSLQYDYGADLIATLDYPIPPNLQAAEKRERVEDSIDSAVECVRLLQEAEQFADWEPVTYAAIHGHETDDIAYYVQQLFERTAYPDSIDGLAIGSLVPLRSGNIDTLIDIVQAATEAIPDDRRDDLALHMFGVGGRLAPLLAVLGVDSYDSSTYTQAANHKKFVHPETFEKVASTDVTVDEWDCTCPACDELDAVGIEDMNRVFDTDQSYKPIAVERDGETRTYMKSDFYALIAHHNFYVFQREVETVRGAIADGRLGDHISDVAAVNDDIAQGLARAAARWPDLEPLLPGDVHAVDNAPDSGPNSVQTKFRPNGDTVVPETDAISLNHTPEDFDVRDRSYDPANGSRVCLIIPCSERKPYSDSKTHEVVRDRLVDAGVWADIHKVTVSGLYGPVPEQYETEPAVTTYDYVLTGADQAQFELVVDRLVAYLDTHGSTFDAVVGYATSKTYRTAMVEAFDRATVGATLLPRDPPSRHLREHFRTMHLDELATTVSEALDEPTVE